MKSESEKLRGVLREYGVDVPLVTQVISLLKVCVGGVKSQPFTVDV